MKAPLDVRTYYADERPLVAVDGAIEEGRYRLAAVSLTQFHGLIASVVPEGRPDSECVFFLPESLVVLLEPPRPPKDRWDEI